MEYMLTKNSEKLISHSYHQTGKTLHAEQLSIDRLVRCSVSTDRLNCYTLFTSLLLNEI